jgi:hypothetical protein
MSPRRTFPPRSGSTLLSWSRSTLDVAVQVEFGKQILQPGFDFIGSRFETRRFQAMGQLNSTCTAPTGPLRPVGPHRERGHRPDVLHQVVPVHHHAAAARVVPDVRAALTPGGVRLVA